MKTKKNSLALALCAALVIGFEVPAHAQTTANDAPSVSKKQSGVDRMKSIMDSLQSGQQGGLSDDTQRAVQTGISSGEKSSKLDMPASTVDFSLRQSNQWEAMSKDAYVASLPPRDRALGQSILLGDGTLPGHKGKLYFFVSRSMPASMLRAYALDALYTGATLVTRGIRKGDTIKEYVEESINDYNNAEGQMLASIEVNPNLFDMFQVDVVPAVVWTNRIGLEDIGSGCQNLPEGAAIPQIELMGPEDRPILLDKPICAPASNTSYYKLTGALALPYVLERFEEAGLSKEATAPIRAGLADARGSVLPGRAVAPVGNAIALMDDDVKLDRMPRHVLQDWKTQLATSNVQRTLYGPDFSSDGEDDPVYREELDKQIRHGLGL